MDALPLALLPAFLTGFDLLRLSHVSRRFFRELLAPDSGIWRARLPADVELVGSSKATYYSSVSMRFFGTKPDESRAAAIDLSQDFSIEDWECDPFSMDLRFALLSSDDNDDALVGGILFGAQSEDWQDEYKPDTFRQFIHVDQEGNLYCSVLASKPVVARNLQRNRWYHLALTVGFGNDDKATQSVYLDGELVDCSDGQMQFEDLYYVQFGTGYMDAESEGKPSPDFAEWYDFNGILDSARIFSECLSHDAVRQLSRGQPPANEVYWQMNAREETMSGTARLVRCTRPTERICTDVVLVGGDS